jgi:hypothetical protein
MHVATIRATPDSEPPATHNRDLRAPPIDSRRARTAQLYPSGDQRAGSGLHPPTKRVDHDQRGRPDRSQEEEGQRRARGVRDAGARQQGTADDGDRRDARDQVRGPPKRSEVGTHLTLPSPPICTADLQGLRDSGRTPRDRHVTQRQQPDRPRDPPHPTANHQPPTPTTQPELEHQA